MKRRLMYTTPINIWNYLLISLIITQWISITTSLIYNTGITYCWNIPESVYHNKLLTTNINPPLDGDACKVSISIDISDKGDLSQPLGISWTVKQNILRYSPQQDFYIALDTQERDYFEIPRTKVVSFSTNDLSFNPIIETNPSFIEQSPIYCSNFSDTTYDTRFSFDKIEFHKAGLYRIGVYVVLPGQNPNQMRYDVMTFTDVEITEPSSQSVHDDKTTPPQDVGTGDLTYEDYNSPGLSITAIVVIIMCSSIAVALIAIAYIVMSKRAPNSRHKGSSRRTTIEMPSAHHSIFSMEATGQPNSEHDFAMLSRTERTMSVPKNVTLPSSPSNVREPAHSLDYPPSARFSCGRSIRSRSELHPFKAHSKHQNRRMVNRHEGFTLEAHPSNITFKPTTRRSQLDNIGSNRSSPQLGSRRYSRGQSQRKSIGQTRQVSPNGICFYDMNADDIIDEQEQSRLPLHSRKYSTSENPINANSHTEISHCNNNVGLCPRSQDSVTTIPYDEDQFSMPAILTAQDLQPPTPGRGPRLRLSDLMLTISSVGSSVQDYGVDSSVGSSCQESDDESQVSF